VDLQTARQNPKRGVKLTGEASLFSQHTWIRFGVETDEQANVTSCGVILRYMHCIWNTQSDELPAVKPLVVFCCNLVGLSDELPLIEIDSR
jgi:hypothetical protein